MVGWKKYDDMDEMDSTGGDVVEGRRNGGMEKV